MYRLDPLISNVKPFNTVTENSFGDCGKVSGDKERSRSLDDERLGRLRLKTVVKWKKGALKKLLEVRTTESKAEYINCKNNCLKLISKQHLQTAIYHVKNTELLIKVALN